MLSRFAAVIGDPVAHSLSPVLHNAAFTALDIHARYEAVLVRPDEVPACIERMRTERWLGMSVTMPHKEAVVALLDDLTPIAGALGAVNCVFWEPDPLSQVVPGAAGSARLVGDNTDGAGVVWALRDHVGVELAGARVVVIGAGGAARACVAALGGAGVADVAVLNRTLAKAEGAAALATAVGRVGTIADLETADIVINATPVGMVGDESGLPAPPVGSGTVAMDLIYHPVETEWLRRSAASGAVVCNGVPMLLGQAAAAFERWTGRPAPVAAMAEALGDAL